MPNDEILTSAVVDSWKLAIKRFDKMLGNFTDEQLQISPRILHATGLQS